MTVVQPAEAIFDDSDRVRFWANVNIGSPTDCWPWKATRQASGYGTFFLNNRKQIPAHRRAWELFHGTCLPESMLACHECDFKPCVNPHHIWAGTAVTNSLDASRKGLSRAYKLLAVRYGRQPASVRRRYSSLEAWVFSAPHHIQEAKAACAESLLRNRTAAKAPIIRGGALFYGIWPGNRVGIAQVPSACIATRPSLVFETSDVWLQCRRQARVGRLCTQHAAMPQWRAFEGYIKKLESRRPR